MRHALPIVAAAAMLLVNAAEAQVAQDRPVLPTAARHNVKPMTVGRARARPPVAADDASQPSSTVQALKAFTPLESMDLDRIGAAPPAFAVPLPPTPAMARPAAPAAAPQSEPPPQVATKPVRGGVRIEPAGGTAILLRTEQDVGAAAYSAGANAIVVLDAPIRYQPPSADIDPAFAQMSSSATLDATIITIPNRSAAFRLSRSQQGWTISTDAAAEGVASILPRMINGNSDASSIRLPVADPSRVVAVLDPLTGQRLLVGTQASAGQAVPNEWQQPQFVLLPTLLGVVVAAKSDDIRLRRDADGFTLSTSIQAEGAIAHAQQKKSDPPIAGAISRLFDIPTGPIRDLEAELQKRVVAASEAHALARSGPRLKVAEAMLALGMDVEAQAVVDVAASADPALLDQPRAIGLRAVAATMAGRTEDASALADARLTGSTEVELWRALQKMLADQASAKDAGHLADGVPLVLAYPAPLRDRLLPPTLEAMALNGQADAAQAVLKTLPDDPNLDLARGMAAEAAGKPADALKAYDQVANRSARLPRYTAIVRATELRIKSGALDARAGADALDRALLGWRGVKQEFDLRTRIADLRQKAGQWREALTVLRDARDIFPDQRQQIDRKMEAIFSALLADDAARHLSPTEFVALYDQNLDLVRDIAWTEKAGTDLVDRLVGLDLQGRAEPIMARLVSQSTDPSRRAVLGAKLASLRIDMDNPSGAIEALSATVPPAGTTVSPSTMQARQLLYARAELGRGNQSAALAMLKSLSSADADEARAEIYAARKDWPQTVAALSALEEKTIQPPNLTAPQQAIVLRLAVAAKLGADSATLARVAGTYGEAMAKSPSAPLFRLMTSAPATGTTDLPRAFEEIQLAKQLAGRIGALAAP